ncbi:helix-turn-helix domain-containing protein [Atopobium fossor]|uniref:helix-turn-helix domain-containing protein n=1 Tax=Atopobium fossor TaxID=39487 RepID=UPI000401D49E|nr:helix-turn-helix transcriptional regulator [Atopobium fossor]
MESSRPGRKRFANMLKFLRELNNAMTQDKLSQESGVAVELIQNYEQEKSLAKDENKERLAEALGACPAVFLAIDLRDRVSNEVNDEVSVVAQLLFQIASSYDLRPVYDEGNVNISYGLAGNGGYIEHALAEWVELAEAEHRNTMLAVDSGKSKVETAIRDRIAERSFRELRKFETGYNKPYKASDYPTCPPRLGETVKRLRSACGLTQDDLAMAAGVSVFTVRGYEQGKRTPNDEQRVAIAKALDVPPEVLIDFGITNPNEAFHYLMEMTHVYYMTPQMGIIGPVIADDRNLIRIGLPKRPSLDKLFHDWYFAWVELQETGDTKKYQNWQDHYEG